MAWYFLWFAAFALCFYLHSSESPYLTLTTVQIKFISEDEHLNLMVSEWLTRCKHFCVKAVTCHLFKKLFSWMLYSSESCESEGYARFSKGCCLMSSGTISDILMLMKKRAVSVLEIRLLEVRRGCFTMSVPYCCSPCKGPLLLQIMKLQFVDCSGP